MCTGATHCVLLRRRRKMQGGGSAVGLLEERLSRAEARGLDFSKYVVEVLREALGKSRGK